MKIAVCTVAGSPADVRIWSGTPANFLQGLSAAGAEVVAIGPLHPWAYNLLNKFSGLTGRINKKINWEAEPAILRVFSRRLDAQLRDLKPDAVILMGWFPVSSGTAVPTIYWGDATIGQRIDLAPHWSNLSNRTRKKAAKVEAESLSALDASFWASEWARTDAMDRYGLTNAYCVPFASNLADPRTRARSIEGQRQVRLLAVGVKWERKGMDRAVETADALIRDGHDIHLDVAGVQPPNKSWLRPYVTYHGLLRKDQPAEADKLHRLYAGADMFLLPTRHEPFGIVFQEAAAYALPVVASSVGGVPEIVLDAVTGTLLDRAATANEYASAVSAIITNRTKYEAMSCAARKRYEERFTWEGCAMRVIQMIENLPT